MANWIYTIAVTLAVLSMQPAIADDLDSLKAIYRRPAEIPFPASNPYTLEKAALGKALFFEPRLSGAQNMNCASCHNPSFGWETPNKTAVGAMNTHLARRAPTILNVAWVAPFFWDGRASSAEEQAKGPIQAAAEMNLPLSDAVTRLSQIPDYQTWFAKVFPIQGVTPDTIAQAIATYERTIVASYAPFDAWIDGDPTAISESAVRGFRLFNGKGRCATCHTGWNFTDNKFHDIGIDGSDIGRGKIEPDNPKAQFAFKTPTLRDIAHRGPYMHDGSFETLEAVVRHYDDGIVMRPSVSALLVPVDLPDLDTRDLIEFLRTLTGSKRVVTLPVLPN